MPTRISFMTHFPDRMGELAGRPTRFPEKIVAGLYIDRWIEGGYRWGMREAGYNIQTSNIINVKHPKTTTIRSNYEYWKKKEGQLIQPFFWSRKPRRSKQVVFCPAVRLKRARKIFVQPSAKNIIIEGFSPEGDKGNPNERFDQFVKNEGFDHPDHFWMWFDKYFNGALLELESVGG